MRRKYTFRDGKVLEIGTRTLMMGILNVTPDSFSDGGKWNHPDRALFHMEEMVKDGADIIDIGAESSRPGFQPMSAAEEQERLRPFLEAVLRECPLPVSVDTFKAETAAMAASMGVHILNDIWGLQYDKEPGRMAAVAAEYSLPVVVTHNRSDDRCHGDILGSIKSFFRKSLKIAETSGIPPEHIIFDPGIGFGKSQQDNIEVLRRLSELAQIDSRAYPLLLGVSRKSFIGHFLGLPTEERMEATGAACVLGIQSGCHILRVHDVKSICRMARMADLILGTDEPTPIP